MLVQCPDTSDAFQITPDFVATIHGNDATVGNGRYTVPTQSLVDSIRTYMESAALINQKDVADAVVAGIVDSCAVGLGETLDPEETYTAVIAVREVLLHRTGPSIVPGGRLTIEVRQAVASDGTVSGVRGMMRPRDDGLFFLRYADDRWVLGNSLYSKWIHEGDRAIVEGFPWACGGGLANVVLSEDWNAILAALRQ